MALKRVFQYKCTPWAPKPIMYVPKPNTKTMTKPISYVPKPNTYLLRTYYVTQPKRLAYVRKWYDDPTYNVQTNLKGAWLHIPSLKGTTI